MPNNNQIPLKQADSKTEQLLLGFVGQEAERIGFGKIMLEITVHNGNLTNVQCTEVKQSLNLNL